MLGAIFYLTMFGVNFKIALQGLSFSRRSALLHSSSRKDLFRNFLEVVTLKNAG
jgi:hypothetical protein